MTLDELDHLQNHVSMSQGLVEAAIYVSDGLMPNRDQQFLWGALVTLLRAMQEHIEAADTAVNRITAEPKQ